MEPEEAYQINKRLLFDSIGSYHFIAIGTGRDGKTEWQVMPDSPKEQPFFNWYCWHFKNEQFFKNIHECVTTYLFWRNKWIEYGKPDWDEDKNVQFTIEKIIRNGRVD